jgi:hypothetical protein
MNKLRSLKRWLIGSVAVGLVLLQGWLTPVVANSSLARELIDLPQTPLNQFPAVLCTDQLKNQFNQQAQVPFDCNIGELLPSAKVLAIGNFANMGVTQLSLANIATASNIDLQNIRADQLRKFYSLITPNKLLSDRFSNFYQNQVLAKIPLVREAFIQKLLTEIGETDQFKSLNESLQQASDGEFIDLTPSDFTDLDKLRQKLAGVALGELVRALPEFGDFSLANLPTTTFQSFSVAEALPDLVDQMIGDVAGVESLMVDVFDAVGLPNYSMSQLPIPVGFLPSVNFGRFDFPLSKDEKDPGQQLSGGISHGDSQLRQQACGNNCKFAEISVPNTGFHGAAWVDGAEHWVADGFGVVCGVWPGGCNGPAGNNPYGPGLRLLLTNIDAKSGSAQVSFTMPICWDILFQGKTCTPSIFPIPTGVPLYTIHEGDLIPFVPPTNYRASLSLLLLTPIA